MHMFTRRIRPVPLMISIVAGCLLAPLGIGRASNRGVRAADQTPPVPERLRPPSRDEHREMIEVTLIAGIDLMGAHPSSPAERRAGYRLGWSVVP